MVYDIENKDNITEKNIFKDIDKAIIDPFRSLKYGD